MFSTNKRSSRRFYFLKGNGMNSFKNDNPLVLELGCRKGNILLGLERYQIKNFVGIDIKGSFLA
jgi:tRNA (guanine-N7-)-methyltransferase